MKNEKQIKRVPLSNGNFATIANDALYDTRLTDKALRLLIMALNNSEMWELNLTYYANKLGWRRETLAKATKCLTDNGYLKSVRKSIKGKFFYVHTINELPCTTKPYTVNAEPEKPYTEKAYITNTNTPKTNLTKTKQAKPNTIEGINTKTLTPEQKAIECERIIAESNLF